MVTITSTLAEDATLIPTLFTTKGEDNSWRVTLADGTSKEVKLGRTNLTHVEVIEGLDPGDTIIFRDHDEP